MINSAKAYTIDEYIEILRRRIWYIIIPFILIVTGASAYVIFAPRQYRAKVAIVVGAPRIPESFVQGTVTTKVEERLLAISQEVLSRTRLEQLIDEMKLYPEEKKTLFPEEIIALMQKSIETDIPKITSSNKTFFVIGYIGRNPNVVAMVANKLASLFIEENLKLREQQALGTSQFLSIEVASTKAKLDQLETTVTQYKRRFMGELPEQRDSNIKIMEQLQNQYQRIAESLRAAQDRKLYLQKQLADMESSGSSQGTGGYEKDGRPASGKSSYLQKEMASSFPAAEKRGYSESQRESLTRSLEELRAKYTENHPDVIAAKKKLADLETKKDSKETIDVKGDIKKDPLYRTLNNQLAMTDIEIARFGEDERNITSQIGKYRARIEQTPTREQDMASLMRDYQSIKETYERLLKKSESAQQAENLETRQQGEQFRIVDPARVPQLPFSPNIPVSLLIGLFAAVGGGFGLAFFREQLDRSFHDSGDVEITLGLKVLSSIPRIEEKTT